MCGFCFVKNDSGAKYRAGFIRNRDEDLSLTILYLHPAITNIKHCSRKMVVIHDYLTARVFYSFLIIYDKTFLAAL